ncbi:hypothetical protein ACP275_14G323400 [Erythranthe tilingii]
MSPETSFGQNDGEIQEESSVVDLDFGIVNLFVSPVPYESSGVRGVESSATMATSDVPAADVLVSAFDSISFAEPPDQRNDISINTSGTDAVDSICQADLLGQRTDAGNNSSRIDSSDFARSAEPSTHGESESVGEIDKSPKLNQPLIVYTSSRRKSTRNTNSKLNHNNEPRKSSRSCRRIAKTHPVLDLNPLKILRRRRSLFSKQARSSGWGILDNILPAFEEHSGLNPNLGNEKKLKRVRCGQGKWNAIGDTGQTSVQKSSTPSGRISLKIRIGNQSCETFSDMGNVTETSGPKKIIPGLSENMGMKFGEELPGDIIHEKSDHMRASTENRCSDPGTSPDSEVINSVPDTLLLEKGFSDMQSCPRIPMERQSHECLANSVPDVSFGDVSSLRFAQVKSKEGKEKDKHIQFGDCSVENKLTSTETTNISNAPTGLGPGQKVNDLSNCTEMNPSSGLVAAIESSNSQVADTLVPCRNGQTFPKYSGAKGGRKSRSGILDLPRKKDKASKKKGDRNNSVGKHQLYEKGDGNCVIGGVESHLAAGNQTSSDLGENEDPCKGSSGPLTSLQLPSAELRDQYVPPRNAWVLCDDCQKWRRIPATLADQIEETNCGWTCKNNTDNDFADCSIPQEKSNSEINEELEISDASGEENAGDAMLKSNVNRSKAAENPSWSLIKSNLFLHRSRKTQTIDEVMVCHCKPPSDGRMGCGSECLNRMLNIECVRGTCPCGEFCSNQQFQKRKYAKLKWFRCGKKGFGLQSLENVSEGQFLIEYVGEVLDIHAYEARQREYALHGHKHFYFMTLNGSEVIDACAKGNLGRYINHSCDPNCRTEKWMVNGEVCVGLFAVRNIKKGEEVTFDYNYVRVFGAAAKRCVCGSPNCRGYIGGDLTNSEVIVQGDSDDEHAEPVMTCEDKEMNDDWNDIIANSLHVRENGSASMGSETSIKKVSVGSASADQRCKTSIATEAVEMMVQTKTSVNEFVSTAAVGLLDTSKDTEESLNTSESVGFEVESEGLLSQKHSPVQLLDASFQSEGKVMKKATSSTLRSAYESEMTTTTLPGKTQPDTIESKRKLKYGTLGGKEELAKSASVAKTRRSSSSIKKGKLKPNIVNEKGTSDVERPNAAAHKSKKLPELSLNSHVETVEEKLNELLDTGRGISKRKDASRGYLKLLFLTAVSGTSGNREAIQSNRDLSMILDALLKTKSRTVLVDVINKNGVQMLHNIMKRYRKEFIKTPILRKLLKVLEYLAMREILTLEHITGGSRPGVESFKDSILTLTEHADKQVHQIARNFRDRWIPRSHRKNCFMEMDDRKMEFHQRGYGRLSNDRWNDQSGKPAEVAECRDTEITTASLSVETSTPNHSASGCSAGTNGTRTRKRKSRWDTPPDENLHSRIRTNMSGDGKTDSDDDVPPGFSSPCIDSVDPDASSTAFNRQGRDTCIKLPFDTVLGDLQQRYISSIPLSYGVPFSLMQQCGNAAPGLPFHPFPPLPPHAHNKGDHRPASVAECASFSEVAEKSEQDNNNNAACVTHHSGEKRPLSWSMDPPEMNNSAENDRPDFQREGGGGGSYSLGRKFFRQQKWNHSKQVPPWVRMRNGWAGHAGNTRNDTAGVGFGNGANQFRSCDDSNWRGDF